MVLSPNKFHHIHYPHHASHQPIINPNGRHYQYNQDMFNLDFKDVLKRIIKYLFEGLAVAFVAYYFTHNKLDITDVIKLGITAAFVFAILDTFSPTISLGARFGAGFGVGQTMFGLNPSIIAGPIMPVI